MTKEMQKREPTELRLWVFLAWMLVFGIACMSPAIASSQTRSMANRFQEISVQCLQSLSKVAGGEVFEGAVFRKVWDGRISLSVDEVPVFLALNENRFSEFQESCGFQVSDVTEQDWGLFVAEFAPGLERLQLKRLRPATQTNFKYAGCAEVEHGVSDLTISAIYLAKSKQVIFSAKSKRKSSGTCE